ncbi:MAG TPA: NlpC/P60 family protein [Frankiaceae bacterium]|nr:NlpC/P60 family protein [Frankiaceae bacterium]
MVRKRLASTALAFGLVCGAYLPLSGGMTASAQAAGSTVHVGARGPQVVYIQRLLGVRQTGYFGNETRSAVIHLQRKYHLPVTGNVTQATAMKMLQILASRKPHAAPRRASSSLGLRALQVAATLRGRPYVYGATGPRTFDCSGYTQYVYSRLGKRLPRTTYQQYAVTKISRSQLRPGDLIFTPDLGHVGIYAGYGSMWNAPHTGASVRLQRVYSSGYLVGRVR